MIHLAVILGWHSFTLSVQKLLYTQAVRSIGKTHVLDEVVCFIHFSKLSVSHGWATFTAFGVRCRLEVFLDIAVQRTQSATTLLFPKSRIKNRRLPDCRSAICSN